MIIVTCYLVIQCTVIATSEPPNFGELNALYYQGICLPEMAYFVLKYYHDYDYGLAHFEFDISWMFLRHMDPSLNPHISFLVMVELFSMVCQL